MVGAILAYGQFMFEVNMDKKNLRWVLKEGIFFSFFVMMMLDALTLQAGTLDDVKKRGSLRCGVSAGVPGFSSPDQRGEWKGIDVDICRAISLAVLGQDKNIKYIPLSAQQRFTALQSGEIDVLTRNTSRTLSRDTTLGLHFAPVNYYDGQGVMVKKSSKVQSLKQLKGATICIQPGTTSELNLSDYFRAHKIKFKPLVIEHTEEVFKTFLSGRCDAFTSDVSQLAADRSKSSKPEDLIILPDVISKEPLSIAVRHGDDLWFDVVTWVVYALIEAEELGLQAQNLDKKLTDSDPRIQRFLGVLPGNGKALGLDEKWSYRIIKELGHYGDIFERNVGMNSPLKLKRGLNQLWNKGGLLYAPPFR